MRISKLVYVLFLAPVAAYSQGATRSAGVITDPFAWYKGSNLALKLMNRSSIGVNQARDRSGAGYGYNEVILNYKINETITAQLHQPFGLAYRGRNSTHIERKDLQFWWDQTEAAHLGALRLSASLRYNAPTGDNSYANHAHLGVAHAEFGLHGQLPLGFSVSWTLHPHYYLNTRNAQIAFEDNAYKVRANSDAQLVNRVQAKYAITPQWAITQHVMLDQTWKRPVGAFHVGRQDIQEIRGGRKQDLQVGTLVAFAPNPHLSLEAGLENKHDMEAVREGRDELQLYHQAKNTYVLSTTLTF